MDSSDILHNKSKLRDFLVEKTLKEDDMDFDTSIRSIFDAIAKNFAAAWLIKCFTKYDESEFHRRMQETYMYNGVMYKGFDFINDMKTHHRKRWYLFTKLAPKVGDVLIFNDILFLNKIITLFEMKGWKLAHHEVQCIHHSILKVKSVVYPSGKYPSFSPKP